MYTIQYTPNDVALTEKILIHIFLSNTSSPGVNWAHPEAYKVPPFPLLPGSSGMDTALNNSDKHISNCIQNNFL